MGQNMPDKPDAPKEIAKPCAPAGGDHAAVEAKSQNAPGSTNDTFHAAKGACGDTASSSLPSIDISAWDKHFRDEDAKAKEAKAGAGEAPKEALKESPPAPPKDGTSGAPAAASDGSHTSTPAPEPAGIASTGPERDAPPGTPENLKFLYPIKQKKDEDLGDGLPRENRNKLDGASGADVTAKPAPPAPEASPEALVKTQVANPDTRHESEAPEASPKALVKTPAPREDVPLVTDKEFATVGKDVLKKLDPNDTEEVSKDQLAKALEDPSFKGKEAQVLAAMYQNFDSLHNLSGHEGFFSGKRINGDDLDSYGRSGDADLKIKVVGTLINVNRGQKLDISHDLYADSEHPKLSINQDGVKQGGIGDCYFEAPLASVASTHPELIKGAIKDNNDGTSTVTFPGDPENPVTVKNPTEAEQGLYNHGSKDGTWASVMEKAYGAYSKQNSWLPNFLGGGHAAQDGADGGGSAAGPMALLTGSDVSTHYTFFNSTSAISENLEQAFSGPHHKAVAAGIGGFTGGETEDGVQTKHVYSVTDYVADGQGSGQVTVRNPWGGKDGTTAGTFTMPLERFMKDFTTVSIEQ